jgi:Enoyl-(Acyl carrier protein) reductase
MRLLVCALISQDKVDRQRADDIANTTIFLFSDASSFITGQAIAVDGGEVRQPPNQKTQVTAVDVLSEDAQSLNNDPLSRRHAGY